jgi:hypothetical protein
LVLSFDYTGIDSLPNNELIYPNPSLDGVFYLSNLPPNCTLDLYDVLGRAVPFKWDSGSLVILNNLPGQFILQITYNGQFVRNIKITNK